MLCGINPRSHKLWMIFVFRCLGTYNNDTMKAAEIECYDCSGGHYCETEGLTEPTGECGVGMYPSTTKIYFIELLNAFD